MNLEFKAYDYTADDVFVESEYTFNGSRETGWEILRNGKPYLKLSPGYHLLKTKSCGVCSTDLARRFLPFPLPQVIGHEVVASDENGNSYVIEINDTPFARNEKNPDTFSMEGIHTHSPERMVLGIDRLPGGFGPYILAPENAMIPFGDLSEKTAVLVEPFAASLQAVESSPPATGDEVAVLGPRRLGSLVIAALRAYKQSSGRDFKIYGLARHDHILDLAMKMGADVAIDLRNIPLDDISAKFAIVYDTTGSVEGFATALKLAAREVHLKSTNGQEIMGLKQLTALVVDELSILPYAPANLNFTWPGVTRKNTTVYAAPGVDVSSIPKSFEVYQCSFAEAEKILAADKFRGKVPRFDIGIAATLSDIDLMIRPSAKHENSLIRPRSAILFQGKSDGNPFLDFITSGKALRSSRCGDFKKAVNLLAENKKLAEEMSRNLISATYTADRLPEAFQSAKDSKYIKVVIEHK